MSNNNNNNNNDNNNKNRINDNMKDDSTDDDDSVSSQTNNNNNNTVSATASATITNTTITGGGGGGPTLISTKATITNDKNDNDNDDTTSNNNNGTVDKKQANIVFPMEWTQQSIIKSDDIPIRYPMDVTDYYSFGEHQDCQNKEQEHLVDDEIIIVGTAGQKITNIGPDFSKKQLYQQGLHIKKLTFRSHMIKKIEGLSTLIQLQLLELYDNQIQSLDYFIPSPSSPSSSPTSLSLSSTTTVVPGSTLRVLDMSFNSIRDMSPVQFCPNLQELYLANNKIKEISGIKNLIQLRKLDLGANRIRIMNVEELNGIINLEELWLGKNKIEEIQGLDTLCKLRRLDIQSNRLTIIQNIIHPNVLEELYLAHNAITTQGASNTNYGLQQLYPKLTVLDICRNQISSIKPFQHLTSLEELWMSGNIIESFDNDIIPYIQQIATANTLQTIYLEYNPVQKNDPLYRKRLVEYIPCLQQIDAYLIKNYTPPPPQSSSSSTITNSLLSKQQQKAKETKEIKSITSNSSISNEEKARQLQDIIFQRAQAENDAKQHQHQQQQQQEL